MKRLVASLLFIDGGDPSETAAATQRLVAAGCTGIDGQTTNPSLIAKNPDIRARMERGERLTREELLAAYRRIVQEVARSAMGPISIEVAADASTSAAEMMTQAREMAAWTANAVIKLPIIRAGLEAAAALCRELALNMTLCFSQAQAAAVYAATRGAKYPLFVSPFIGRLDDRGENGIDLIRNILRMYAGGDSHVRLLAASIRNQEHLFACLYLRCPAITMPFRVFQEWADAGFSLPPEDSTYTSDLRPILYQENLSLDAPWESFPLGHPLTDSGLQKFADDWNKLLAV